MLAAMRGTRYTVGCRGVEMIIAAAHIGRLGGKLLVAPDWSYFPSTKRVLMY